MKKDKANVTKNSVQGQNNILNVIIEVKTKGKSETAH